MNSTHKGVAGRRVLIVEDEVLIAEEIRERLLAAGCDVLGPVDTGAAAIATAASGRPEIVLMDIHLKGAMDGIDAAEAIFARQALPVVYLTAHSDYATLQRAKATAAYGYVVKPFAIDNLMAALEVALHRAELEQRLRESELTCQTILASVADAVIATDRTGRVRFMNESAEQLTGQSLVDVQGEPIERVLTLAGRRTAELVAGAARSQQAVVLEGEALERSGSNALRLVDCTAQPIVDGIGRVVGVALTLRDTTTMRRLQSDLVSLAEQLRTVIDTAADGVALLDAQGRVQICNPAFARTLAYPAEALIGRPLDMLVPQPLTDDHGRPLPAPTGDARAPVVYSARPGYARARGGRQVPVEVSVGQTVRSADPAYVVVLHDVSERRSLERAVLDAIRNEQQHLADELHDGLGQDLTGLSLVLAAMSRNAEITGLANAEDLVRVAGAAQHAVRTCRGIAQGLSPVGEGQGGLVAGLRDLVQRLGDIPGKEIRFSAIEEESLGLSPPVMDHLYRVAQEALSNALRHSDARSIKILLDVGRQRVRLEVCDDGHGMPAASEPGRRDPGLGLRTMRHRAAVIGARLWFERPGAHGTCVVCECPKAA